MRQAYIHEQQVLSLKTLYRALKPTEAYQALPRKVSNQVLLQLKGAWSSYFKALAAWRADPTKFLGQPRLPKYKPKTDGRNLLVYEQRAVQRRALKQGLLKVSGRPWPSLRNTERSHKCASCPTGALCGRNCLSRSDPTQYGLGSGPGGRD
jgi:putative transposase